MKFCRNQDQLESLRELNCHIAPQSDLENDLNKTLVELCHDLGIQLYPHHLHPSSDVANSILHLSRQQGPHSSGALLNIGGSWEEEGFHVWIDDHHRGQLAAEHLVACGSAGMVYIGNEAYPSSRNREQGIALVCRQKSIPFLPLNRLQEHQDLTMHGNEALLKELVGQIPVGYGVICYTALTAKSVVRFLMNIHRNVPLDHAVVSADENSLFTSSGSPTITAVGQNGKALGRLALRTLLDLSIGKQVPRVQLLPAGPLLQRESSATKQVQDAVVESVLSNIRRADLNRITIESLSVDVGLSQRQLRNRFKALGLAPPNRHLLEEKMNRAKGYLKGTTWTTAEVAKACGYESVTRFTNTLKKEIGLSPSKWRKA